MNKIIRQAKNKNQKILSEFMSKQILEASGIPIARQGLATGQGHAANIARTIGYPVALKGCGAGVSHKTELGLVELNITDEALLIKAYGRLLSKGVGLDGVLVSEMIRGDREFVMGLGRDPQFGPYVMFGLGGVLTEALRDVSFRIAPLTRFDAVDMTEEIRAAALLGQFRGDVEADRDHLASLLIRLGQIGLAHPEIKEIDINPLVLKDGRFIAVDALVVLDHAA